MSNSGINLKNLHDYTNLKFENPLEKRTYIIKILHFIRPSQKENLQTLYSVINLGPNRTMVDLTKNTAQKIFYVHISR